VIAALPTLSLARLEPVTQIFFPDERAGQPLVGVGARELGKQLQSHLSFSTRILGVRTWWSRAPDPQLQMYAVGLYAHRIGLQLALLKLKGEERAASELPPGFFEAVCGGFAKTIVIKMACSMSREQIAGEFVESVQQRMGSGGSKELEALQEIIQKGCADAQGGRRRGWHWPAGLGWARFACSCAAIVALSRPRSPLAAVLESAAVVWWTLLTPSPPATLARRACSMQQPREGDKRDDKCGARARGRALAPEMRNASSKWCSTPKGTNDGTFCFPPLFW